MPFRALSFLVLKWSLCNIDHTSPLGPYLKVTQISEVGNLLLAKQMNSASLNFLGEKGIWKIVMQRIWFSFFFSE